MTTIAAARTRLILKRDGTDAWARSLTMLGMVTAAILLLFARDAVAMASIWWDSSTFNHCLFLPPIIGWLVIQRRDVLERLTPEGWAGGLPVVGVGALAWLLGDAASVGLARHLGLILMLQGAAVTLLGPAVSRALLFPIAYALFLVPFGEELVPPLQTLTAKLAMIMIGLSGIPAHIDGVFITISNGWFEVAEACSGVKFLIAMIAYGALVANVCFRSARRRAGFMLAAILVPILANGVRAFATIWFAARNSADAAAGMDHVVYGWVFFGVVITLVMAIGWRFFDRAPGDPWVDVDRLPYAGGKSVFGGHAAAVLALVLAPLAWSAVAAGSPDPLPAPALPSAPGWSRLAPSSDWRAHFAGANRYLTARYAADGRTVDLTIAVYATQREGRELVGFGQGAVAEDSVWAWSADLPAPRNGAAVRIVAPGPVTRDVLSYYRIGGVTTGNAAAVKLETVKTRLLGRDQRAVAVLISARGPAARNAIDAFLRDIGSIDRVADRASGRE